jgi:hypothetical protein
LLSCRRTTKQDIEHRGLWIDPQPCVSVVNPAGGVLAIFDVASHPARREFISPQADPAAVQEAMDGYQRQATGSDEAKDGPSP